MNRDEILTWVFVESTPYLLIWFDGQAMELASSKIGDALINGTGANENLLKKSATSASTESVSFLSEEDYLKQCEPKINTSVLKQV